MEVTRRDFLASGTAAVTAADKFLDGGLAPVTPPGAVAREHPLVPAGAQGMAAFKARCVGCQLCVTACPNGVLRPASAAGRFLLPEMGFERGWCDVSCQRCAAVCPTGAIRPVPPAARRHIHIGRAVFHKDRCLTLQEGVVCDACVRHCPVKALYPVPCNPADPAGPRYPVVDAESCIGCGACEYLCPARPVPALTVEGLDVHRAVTPMGTDDLIAEGRRVLTANRAAVMAFQDGVVSAHAAGRGLAPLLNLYDEELAALHGALLVDRVVGRAAAAVCVLAGVKRVHGLTFSAPARNFLTAHKIAATGDAIVPEILNRDKTAPCPLEEAVRNQSDPARMLATLRRTLSQLKKKK